MEWVRNADSKQSRNSIGIYFDASPHEMRSEQNLRNALRLANIHKGVE